MMDDDQQAVTFVTKGQLIDDLRRIGVRAGDTLMLHVSVKAIGWIVGGPRIVLEALFDVLSPEGTLMMLASWEGNPYELSDWPEDQQARWLAECPPFDPLTSPADHREMSILAEYLRTWPQAQRSAHPLSSFVAVGRRAQWLTEHHPINYGHGADSPLERLCQADGRVLLLGDILSNLTLLHHAEHLVELPHKRIDRYKMPILQDGKRVWIDVEEFDTTNGIADFGVGDYFREIGQSYVSAGYGQTGTVGEAQAYLFDVNEITAYAIEWMTEHHKG
jgi:aminoglycoside 3-N-acetyltransferase